MKIRKLALFAFGLIIILGTSPLLFMVFHVKWHIGFPLCAIAGIVGGIIIGKAFIIS